MTPAPYTEDILVQQTTAEYLENQLSCESVYAYNQETFGPDGMLGRASDREVVLTRHLLGKQRELNPGLPNDAYTEAVRQIVEFSSAQTLLATNRDKYSLFKEGVQVAFRNAKGERVRDRLRIFDFANPENNDFLAVRELWVRGDLYRRRADIIGFVNEIPLLFIECKNIHKSLQQDREKADISDIIRQLHQVVDEAIATKSDRIADPIAPNDISRIDFERLRREFERSSVKRTIVQNLKQAIDKKLLRLLAQNPLRTDFQKHYEEVVVEYNLEKDRLTIEKTFEGLLKLVEELDEEESRAIREGLDEESLALFDLLKKPDLKATDIQKIKKVVAELLETLKAEKLKIDHWRDKESTRDAARIAIRDFLWSDKTGLPINAYTENEVGVKAEDVFRHVYRAYPTVPSPFYATAI